MTDRVLLITPPDDILISGIRITLVHLDEQQSQIISESLLSANLKNDVITFVWKMGDPVSWLLDKIAKSDLVIFNPEGKVDPGREIIIGWTAAQPQSYYFGNLRDLSLANDRVIYNKEDILKLLEKADNKNG